MKGILIIYIFLTSVYNVTPLADDSIPIYKAAWKEALNAGGMYIGGTRTKRFIQTTNNQPNIPYQACTTSTGVPGRCRHIQYCIMPEFQDNAYKMFGNLCIIEGKSVGICCPDGYLDSRANSLAGDLPATAPDEDEAEVLTRISKAENRGCGVTTRAHTRVIGARPANPKEWPWMASITPHGIDQYAGGVLITDRHVLTAAHTTRRYKPEDLLVRLGEYDLASNTDTRSYDFKVVEIRQHEEFELSSYHHDIALLKLHKPAVFNSYVWPICLPPAGMELTNKSAIIIGWGTQSYGGPFSNVLMEVSVPVWDHQKCVDSFTATVFDGNLCAGDYEGGKDSCQGDSGGPLLYQMPSGRWTSIGLVSWGVRCGEARHPGVYTKVENYLTWIMMNTRF